MQWSRPPPTGVHEHSPEPFRGVAELPDRPRARVRPGILKAELLLRVEYQEAEGSAGSTGHPALCTFTAGTLPSGLARAAK